MDYFLLMDGFKNIEINNFRGINHLRIEDFTHHAQVEFVNYAHVGGFYADINYEVEVMCCGERKTLFIDEDKAMPKDF